jgi:hypothetical protein
MRCDQYSAGGCFPLMRQVPTESIVAVSTLSEIALGSGVRSPFPERQASRRRAPGRRVFCAGAIDCQPEAGM